MNMLKELFKYKELIYELAIRDLKLRYRKPFFGFLWMLIIPFCTAFIYKIFFYDFMHIKSGNQPFFILLVTALLPWNYFTSSVQGNVRCILDNRGLINQISFPKYLLPISTVLANLICFIPAIAVLIIFLFAFNIRISAYIIFLPLVILLHTCLIVGLSLMVAAWEVIYRDIEYVIQVIFMALFFLIPAAYTFEELITRTSDSFRAIYMLNPLVGILNLYRITFIGGYLDSMPKEINYFNTFIIPLFFSIFVLVAGYFIFNKYKDRFFDYLNV